MTTSYPDLAGFHLYQREESTPYTAPIAIINDPNAREYELQNVPDGKNFYWMMRAFDFDGLEPPNSNEINQNLTGSPLAPGGFKIKVIVDVNISQ